MSSNAPDSATAPHTPQERAAMLLAALASEQHVILSARKRAWLVTALVGTIEAACQEACKGEAATILDEVDRIHHESEYYGASTYEKIKVFIHKRMRGQTHE